MKRALKVAIIAVFTATTAFAQVLGINSIRKPIVSSEAKPNVEQSKEITPELKPIINSVVMVDLSKELAIKPVIISEVRLISDPPKVLQKGKAAEGANL